MDRVVQGKLGLNSPYILERIEIQLNVRIDIACGEYECRPSNTIGLLTIMGKLLSIKITGQESNVDAAIALLKGGVLQ